MKEVWLIWVKSNREKEVHSVSGCLDEAKKLMSWLEKTHADLEYWIEGRPMYDF